MSLWGRELARRRTAERQLIEQCPNHKPICIGVGGKKLHPILFYRCDTCKWEGGMWWEFAMDKGLPFPDNLPPIKDLKEAIEQYRQKIRNMTLADIIAMKEAKSK